MQIEFDGVAEGKKIYRVKRGPDRPLFMGTLDQCRRFVEVYKEKVLKRI